MLYILGVKKLCGSVQVDNKEAILINIFLGAKYTEKIVIPQDGKDVIYLTGTGYTKEDFDPHKDATLLEYARFVKKNKNKILF